MHPRFASRSAVLLLALMATAAVGSAAPLENFTIAASNGSGGAIMPAGDITVPAGGTQAFDFQPYTCNHVQDVVVDGVSVGAMQGYTFTNVSANHTIAVSFAANGPSTITASAGAGGSITPSGSVPVTCGGEQAFTIAAAGGSRIADVRVDGVSVGAVSSYTFTNVLGPHTIAATFTANGFTITATAGAGGSISPSGAVTVASGGTQAFAITPDASYAISGVRVDGASVGAVTSYTFTNVTGAHTISASFVPGQAGPPLDCSRANAWPARLWPPSLLFVPIAIRGVRDADGSSASIRVTRVTSDEPVTGSRGAGDLCPDAVIVDGRVRLRAERMGSGNGRTYVIHFTAYGAQGGSCDGAVTVVVPHDARAKSQSVADDGQKFDAIGLCIPTAPATYDGATGLEISAAYADGSTGTLDYSLPDAAAVTVTLFDVSGRRVATLLQESQQAGTHRLEWSTAGIERGMYFYRLQAGAASVGKPVLVRH